MLFDATLCSSASSSVRNSRVDTGSLAAFRCRKKSISMPADFPWTPSPRFLQQKLQMPLDHRPLALDDAEHDGVAIAAVGCDLMMAQHAILLGAEPQDRVAGSVIEPVGAKFHGDAAELLEGVRQQEQLALGIDR